jgi:hypothetical protein
MSERATTSRPRSDTVLEFAQISSEASVPANLDESDLPSRPVRSVRLVSATKRLFEALWNWFWVLLDECLVNRSVAGEEPGWVDQAQSPLGRRGHCALVRKGVLKGHKVGKRIFIRREELGRYIESHAAATAAPPPPTQAEDEGDEIARKLKKIGFATKESKR